MILLNFILKINYEFIIKINFDNLNFNVANISFSFSPLFSSSD